MAAVPERIKRLQQRPWIAHMIRAVERYISRLGSQFAAATSYFSVLALVPILMVAFSITGFVLTVVQPGLLDDVADAVAEALGSTDAATREKILDLVNNALSQYLDHWHRRPGGRPLYRRQMDGPLEECGAHPVATRIRLRPQQINIVIRTVVNLALLLGFLLGMAVTLGLASLSTSFANTVVNWLGLW